MNFPGSSSSLPGTDRAASSSPPSGRNIIRASPGRSSARLSCPFWASALQAKSDLRGGARGCVGPWYYRQGQDAGRPHQTGRTHSGGAV